MPATIDWHPKYPAHVLAMTVSSPVTLEELIKVSQDESALIQNADHIVHTIIDITENVGVPNGLMSGLLKIGQMPAASHPNAGTKVVVGADGVAKIFLNIFSKVHHKVHLVASMDDAIHLIDTVLTERK